MFDEQNEDKIRDRIKAQIKMMEWIARDGTENSFDVNQFERQKLLLKYRNALFVISQKKDALYNHQEPDKDSLMFTLKEGLLLASEEFNKNNVEYLSGLIDFEGFKNGILHAKEMLEWLLNDLST